MKGKNFNYTLLLFILILISYLFNLINVNIYNNSSLSIGVIFYSLTYLVTFKMIKKNKISDNKKILFSSVLYFLLFFVLTTILCQFNSENDLLVSLRNVFTPTSYAINNFTFYYPDVYKIIIYLLVYFFSHYIFMITYDVSEINTGYLVGFLVSMLIGFILDKMLYTTIYYLPDIIISNLTVIDFLKTLTSNFIVTLITSIILLIFVPILNIVNINKK